MNANPVRFSRRAGQERASHGFTLIELLIVLIVSLVLAAMAVSNLMRAAHTARLRGATADYASLIESDRIFAIRDNRFYSMYVLPGSGNAPQEAYVDMLPKSLTGASGNGGTSVASGDPVIAMSSEVTPQPASNAPSTSNLSSQLFPSTTTVTPNDASSATSALTFGPRGLPCAPIAVTAGTVSGTVCDSSGGPTAYWIFFQDSLSNNWTAVTVTPAGRIQRWYYSNTVWAKF